MIVVSYYTLGTPYETLVKGFIKALKTTNPDLEVIVQPILCQGSWVSNCSQKSSVLLELLTTLKDDLLYLDIDAIVKRKIELPQGGEDIAVYFRGNELLSGTIYLKNTIEAREILNWWVEAQSKNELIWDQKVLANVIKDKKIKVGRLDERMCSIFDSKERSKDPIVVHNQASRKFKKFIGGDVMDIPKVIGRMRILHNRDGTVSIARQNREAEKWLDDNLERLPNQLRWRPKFVTKHGIDKLVLQGKSIYLIGKGPSLDNLTKKDFKDKKSPIFCINESIHAIEKLDLPNDIYVVLQDALLRDTCKPKNGGVICSKVLSNFYPENENKYVFDPKEYFTTINYTVVIAINIAKKHGMTNFKMMGFDSIVNGDTKYASSIGYQHPKNSDPKRYEKNDKGVKLALKGVESEFICPTAPRKASDGKPEPKGDISFQKKPETQD